ncbi:hypothetical protein L596_001571 [Steinernema carpocapsae]|uniref:Uncharacterized protein n=1 Tax=Steinernema carpocapsae TaxID=34508 RepID=A0A4U8ULV0_STECR|nr:hypothetical protein L596_001571 [Steinernema carpocapsae]
MIVGMHMVGETSGVEAAISYAGDVSTRRERYNLDYYMKLTDELVKYSFWCFRTWPKFYASADAARIMIGAIRRAVYSHSLPRHYRNGRRHTSCVREG